MNVRITLSEDHQRWTEKEYENIICDAIEEKTTNYQICVDVHTVTPEIANPKEAECKYADERCNCAKGLYREPLSSNGTCLYGLEYRKTCKYYEPKREEKKWKRT